MTSQITASAEHSTQRLLGRSRELRTLDGILAAVRAAESRALVLRREPGIGKSALLEHLARRAARGARRAAGWRVVRAAGVQSEAELAFAGLAQLCGPLLEYLERIPAPQQRALRTALGLSAGAPPDRLLIGLAVLSLLSEAGPLVCLVDDVQWLDRASAEALAFVARRLLAESVAVVFAARDAGAEHELAGLPELRVSGLSEPDARTLLGTVLVGPLDERVRDRIVAETRGNPLALLELPHGRTPAELAGGFALPLSGRWRTRTRSAGSGSRAAPRTTSGTTAASSGWPRASSRRSATPGRFRRCPSR